MERSHALVSHKIAEDRIHQRLDNYLINKIKTPKSLVYNLLRRGKIRVNQKKQEPSYRLQEDDIVSIPQYLIDEANQSQNAKPTLKPQQVEWLDSCIVFENEFFLIVNKPSGLASHGGSGHSFGLVELLRQRWPQKNFELIHRLDRETSGLMVVAKKRSALRQLNEAFANRQVQKFYLAIMSGVCKRKEIVDAPLNIVRSLGIRKSVVDYAAGQSASTVFVPLSRHLGQSLCLVMPETGRMHQIRAHSAFLGLPLKGDALYEGTKADKMYLHAALLAFEHQGKAWVFEQAPPDFWEEEFFNGWDLWKTISKHRLS